MTKARLGALAVGVALAGVYGFNCVKNVVVGRRVRLVCPALAASASERLSSTGPLFDRLFGADASLMRTMPDAVVGDTCAQLEHELVWYRWNLGRTIRLDRSREHRQQLVAVLDRAIPACVSRAAAATDAEHPLDQPLAEAMCQVLKTLRATLDTPLVDGSVWALAEHLERLVPAPVRKP
ncbi:MAG: hypothetical protein SFW67_34545 [Myxococcaceae bacterium]|nr:hypothetical protein [Myxococcaceae bacterium]